MVAPAFTGHGGASILSLMQSDRGRRGHNPIHAVATFVQELRDDLGVAPLWQQGLLVAAVALAGLFITMLALAIADRGDGTSSYEQANADAPRHNSSGDIRNGEAPEGGGQPGVVQEPNRQDCDAIISGGAYNNTEREWALANCPEINEPVVFADVTPTPVPAVSGPVQPPFDPGSVTLPPANPTAPPPATPTSPPPPPGFAAGDAISIAISYYASAPDGHYMINPSSCNATPGAGTWYVTCVGTLKGCTRVECTTGLTACVVEATRNVFAGLC